MKKLDVVQMEGLQGGLTFDQCMDKVIGKWQVAVALGALTVLGGHAGLAGGVAGAAAYCAKHT